MTATPPVPEPAPPHPIDRAQSWSTVDADIASYVRGAIAVLEDEPGARLSGVILQGSLASGCFYRAKSDLDLLVVVEDPMPPESRARVARGLVEARRAGRSSATSSCRC